MTEGHNFIQRWSRRKSEQQREELEPKDVARTAPANAAPDPLAEDRVEARESTAANEATDGEPTFDLASLPPIESIGAETDIRPFLRPGVPGELRNAALRRAWSVDSAIRNFKGLAENDWDFNDPNGAHGFGPLDPGFDVEKMAAALFREAPKESSTPVKDVAGFGADERQPPDARDQAPEGSVGDDPADTKNNIAVQKNADANPADATTRRRSHGGALPKT